MRRFERHFAAEPLTPQTFPRAPAGQLAETGQVLEAEALAGFGEALTDVSAIVQKWYEREGNSQYDTGRKEARERWNKFDLTNFPDADAFDKEYKKMRADVAKIGTSLSNKVGKNRFKSWDDLQSPGWDRRSAEKKIRMIKINNTDTYFKNISSIAAETDLAKAQAEARLLTQGAIDDRIRTPAQADSDFEKVMGDWLRADVWRKATVNVRPDGEVDWNEAVKWFSQAENIEGIDPKIIDGLLGDANSQLTNQKKRDDEAIEKQREASRDFLNDKFANDQIPTPEEIDKTNLDEAEQKQYIKWATAETRRTAKGEDITTNQKARADLNTMALDIWRGTVTKQQFDTAVNEARYGETPTIDDPAYKELTNTAATTLKSAQAEALRRADTEAGRLIVDVRDEQTVAAIMARFSQDEKKRFILRRQLQFWYLSQYNKEMRDWITENPDKIGKDFYQFSESLKHDYWNTSINEVRRQKFEREEELAKPKEPATPKTQAEYDALPSGAEYRGEDGKLRRKK